MKGSFFHLALLTVLITFFSLVNPVVSSAESSDAMGGLENAIIIRGINTPESDISGETGRIIFDDAFHDTIAPIEPAPTRRIPAARQERNHLSELRKEDARWHLVSYTIRKGDNLWSIAKDHGTTHQDIIRINNIAHPDRLLPGKVLQVPSKKGTWHTVTRGDTLSGIAHEYKIDIKKIRDANDIKDDRIYIGDRLFLPDTSMRRVPARTRPATIPATRHVRRHTQTASSFKIQWPMKGHITSGFGKRNNPFNGKPQFHYGIDISAVQGTPVAAAADGIVIFSGWKVGYGNTMIVRHSGGYVTVYAHHSKNLAKEGTPVKAGDIIAKSGQTGNVTGAHLHFELRKYLTPLNPMAYIK